jgi:hypothetical protein
MDPPFWRREELRLTQARRHRQGPKPAQMPFEPLSHVSP